MYHSFFNIKKTTMIKLRLLPVLFFFFSLSNHAQTTKPTSMYTYNYITGRLVNDLKTSYGIKPGATMENSGYSKTLDWPGGVWRKCSLSYYKESGVIMAYILVLKDSYGNYDIKCLPTKNSDSDVKGEAGTALYNSSSEWKSVYIALLNLVAINEL
jgi:hypothetical protein